MDDVTTRSNYVPKNHRAVRLYQSDTESRPLFIDDPMAFQIESYKTAVDSYSVNNSKYKQGNIIKFWIKDLNNQTVMTTPSFLTDITDGGLTGKWE